MSESAVIPCASWLVKRAKSIAARWGRWALLFLLTASPLFAQSHTLEVSQYLHISWTSQEGYFKAGISAIQAIAQTSDGYLWLAGNGSVLRFDGVRFTDWKPPANNSLPRSPIRGLLAARDGSLWIGGIGLAELKPNGEFRRYPKLDETEIDQLAEDKDGGIWAAGGGHQEKSPFLCRVYRGDTDCFPVGGPLGWWASVFHRDDNGQLWVCAHTGIWRLQPGPPQRLAPVPGVSNFFGLDRDADGSLIFTTGEGMYVATAGGKIHPYPLDVGPAKALLKDREGGLWVGTVGRGIVHIHQGRMDRFTTSDGLSANNIKYLFQDREGNVWAGTGLGLDKFTKPAVPTMTSKQGLLNDQLASIITDRNGVTWVGARGGIHQIIDGHATKYTVNLPNDMINTFFETSKGHMLVTIDAKKGVVWLDGKKARSLPANTGEVVFQIAEGHHGDLWLASMRRGVMHLREDGTETEDVAEDAVAIAFDPKRDGVWLTTQTGGLEFLKDGKVVERYGPKDGLGDGIVRDPQVDSDGGVWASTRVGLAHLKDGKISILNHKNGLPCDAMHWMRHDGDRNVWCIQNAVCWSFQKANFLRGSASPPTQWRSHIYWAIRMVLRTLRTLDGTRRRCP
jgi:ligand-binding sensor domain-containing protein